MEIKRRLAIIVVVLAPAGGMAVPTQPAMATSTAVFSFIGTAAHGPLGYPCTPPGTTCPPAVTTSPKTDPKGLPMVNVRPAGRAVGFSFSSGTCVDTKVAVMKEGKAPATAGNCAVNISGILYGYCGFFELVATMAYRSSNGTTYSFSMTKSVVSLAGVTIMTGGNSQTNATGELVINHGPGCAVGSSTTATVEGSFTLKDLTP